MAARVMIVEDSPTTRSMLISAIEDLGDYTVVEAANGFEALKKLPEFPPDLLITDINMPDINGLEVVRFVKENPRYRLIPVIIVTTEGRDVDRERGMKLGADRYVIKPFKSDELKRHIRELLGKG